jgi:hypothetical protein
MSRRLLVPMIAGVVAVGCSRDAPLAPEPISVNAAAPAAIAQVAVDDPVEDALTRLLPALGPRAAALQGPLLRLQARPKDRAAQAAVQRALDALAPTLQSEFLPDLDAIRLQLGIAFPE